MAKLKTKILLEMIDDIITEHPNIKEFKQRKLIEKCDRDGIPIDEIRLEAKTFFSRFKSVMCFIKGSLVYVWQKGGLTYVY